jgi:hypothetical protein
LAFGSKFVSTLSSKPQVWHFVEYSLHVWPRLVT